MSDTPPASADRDLGALAAPRRRLRVCLAGSGGGHVRQILDLEPAWSEHDYFFVTEDTALGRSLAERHPVSFVPHYAAGQARMGAGVKMLGSALANLLRSAAIILSRRPDVVVSTGAGAVFFCVLWGRLLGARVVAVESFARFDRPSLFARLAFPIAHDTVVQSAALAPRWPKAKVYDPLRILDGPRPAKKPLLFATVGATLKFDRLVAAVAGLKASGALPEDVIIQTGEDGLKPPGLTARETLGFEEIQALLRDAEFVVCHGGTGSLITALRQGCHVIAMPRLARLNEHYDDHQSEITEAFVARGLIQVAGSQEELGRAIAEARRRPPVMATTAPEALIDFLRQVFAERARRLGMARPDATPLAKEA